MPQRMPINNKASSAAKNKGTPLQHFVNKFLLSERNFAVARAAARGKVSRTLIRRAQIAKNPVLGSVPSRKPLPGALQKRRKG